MSLWEMPATCSSGHENCQRIPSRIVAFSKDEFGDVLFSLVNVARKLDMDPEDALRQANAKFEARFTHMENALTAAGRSMEEADLDEMIRHWDQAKAQGKTKKQGTGPGG